MPYGLHIAKDDNSGYFSYTGSIFQLKYIVIVNRPFNGSRSIQIPPAPAGFSYEIVPTYSFSTFGAAVGPHQVPPEKLSIFYTPESSTTSNVVQEITITDAGVVTYIGGSSFITGDISYRENNNFSVYIKGKK